MEVGSKAGTSVVRLLLVAHLAPLKDKPRAGAQRYRGASSDCCTHPSWRPSALQGSPGSCTHRAVFHSVHQVPGLGRHVPRRGREGDIRTGSEASTRAVGVWPGKDVFQEDKCYTKFIPSGSIERLDSQEISTGNNHRCAMDLEPHGSRPCQGHIFL